MLLILNLVVIISPYIDCVFIGTVKDAIHILIGHARRRESFKNKSARRLLPAYYGNVLCSSPALPMAVARKQKNLFHHLTAIRAWAPFGYTFSFLLLILLLILKKFVSQLSRQNTDFRPENSNGGRRLEVRFQGASDTSGVSAGVFACMAAEMRLHRRG